MKSESGRSLIEVIGVMAIAGVMTVSALGVFNMLRANQSRSIAGMELKQIAENTKILLEMRGSYDAVSVNYLIKSGALQSDKAPLGGEAWSITPSADGSAFSINLVDLTNGECNYFASKKPAWVKALLVNGFEADVSSNCFDSDTNQVSFVVE